MAPPYLTARQATSWGTYLKREYDSIDRVDIVVSTLLLGILCLIGFVIVLPALESGSGDNDIVMQIIVSVVIVGLTVVQLQWKRGPNATIHPPKPNWKDSLGVYKKGRHWTCDPTTTFYRPTSKAGPAACPRFSVIDMWDLQIKNHPDRVYLAAERPVPDKNTQPESLPWNQWMKWTNQKCYEDLIALARFYCGPSCKFPPYGTVSIHGYNAPEWLLCGYASHFAGGKYSGIYPTDTAEHVIYKHRHSMAQVICVDSYKKVDWIIKKGHLKELPDLRCIIVWGDENVDLEDKVIDVEGPENTGSDSNSIYPSKWQVRICRYETALQEGRDSTHVSRDDILSYDQPDNPYGEKYDPHHKYDTTVMDYDLYSKDDNYKPTPEKGEENFSRDWNWPKEPFFRYYRGRARCVRPGMCSVIVYTSGTTGNPKAVMITHDMMLYSIHGTWATSISVLDDKVMEKTREYSSGEYSDMPSYRVLSYLPLSHIAGIMIDMVLPITTNKLNPYPCGVFFARPYDLKDGTIGHRLRFARPSTFAGVPRVWEKIAEKMKAVAATAPPNVMRVAKWSRKKHMNFMKNRQLIDVYNYENKGENSENKIVLSSGAYPRKISVANKIANKVLDKLGLDRCVWAASAAAPITAETLQYFAGINLNIVELYGMSESCGHVTMNTVESQRWGTVGFSQLGTEVMVLDTDSLGGNESSKGTGKANSNSSSVQGTTLLEASVTGNDNNTTVVSKITSSNYNHSNNMHIYTNYVPYQLIPSSRDVYSPAESEQGEICFRGRLIMMGYLGNKNMGYGNFNQGKESDNWKEMQEKTNDAIDEYGMLHSGDKGAWDPFSFVRVTGRYKELIIGSGGENIAPVPIEDWIKSNFSAISNVLMIGDKRKYNVALVTLKAVGATGEFPGTDELDGDAKYVNFGGGTDSSDHFTSSTKMQSKNIKITTVKGDVVNFEPKSTQGTSTTGVTTISQAMTCPIFKEYIELARLAVNANESVVFNNACKIQKMVILPRDFSIETKELTPTLKVKRSVAEENFREYVEAMYKE